MKGQVALVTGASGEIGAEIARQLAGAGVSVALHYHSNEASVARLGEEISRLGVPYTTVQADLSNEEHVRALWDKVEQELGPIDVLIANAGTYRQELIGIQNLSLDEWNHTLGTNLTSVFLCFREFFNGIVRHALTSPSAVMIGSMSGVWGDIGHCDYAASKAGMLSGLLPTLKDELTRLAPNGRINAVAPGFVATGMISGVLKDRERVRKVLQTASLRRVATVHDVAAATVFLASGSLSAHITGEIIKLKGGKEGRVLFDQEEINL